MIASTLKTVTALGSTASSLVGTTLGAVNCGLNCLNDEIKGLHSEPIPEPNKPRKLLSNLSKNKYSFLKKEGNNWVIKGKSNEWVLANCTLTESALAEVLLSRDTLKILYKLHTVQLPCELVLHSNIETIEIKTEEDRELAIMFANDIFDLA